MKDSGAEFPEELIERLRRARRIAVLTGAGVSAESGVPTFRDALTGLWSQYSPQELATPEAFRRNPRRVWEWYAERREKVRKATPNPGHCALAEMERRTRYFTLITQNVDGLHQRAGSQSVIELHGNLARARCSREDTVVESWKDDGQIPPRCPRCGSFLRPDVVWFGEMLPERAVHVAFDAARTCEVFFSIGTSGEVEPAASLAYEAQSRGATVVEVNKESTPLSPHADFCLVGPSGQVLPALVRAVWKN